MRLREFAPNPGSNEPSGDFPMSWDQIVDRFRQVLTHHLGWRLEAGSGRTASFSKGPMLFVINQYTSPKQIQYYINDGQRQWKGFKFTQWSSITQLLDTVRSLPLNEFAPSPGYGGNDEDDVPRYLMQLANLWWNQSDPEAQEEVTRELAGGGWTIRQIDDDTVLLNHKEYGITYRISDDQFDPDLYEFAPTSHRNGGEGGGGDDEERKVGPYAQRWFENPNDHPRIRSILKSQGYTVLARGWTHTEIAIQNDKTGRKMIFFDPDAIDPYE